MIADYEEYDGMGLAELVRKREVKPEEVLETTLARAAERNPALNAIVTPLYDEARRALAAGLPEGPFTGVPFLLKDLENLAGTRTTSGANVFKDNVETRKRKNVGDTCAHLACADHSYAFDAHAGSDCSLRGVD